jgi:UDP-3-O-acyl-N-acetylglucosamine deacetylase
VPDPACNTLTRPVGPLTGVGLFSGLPASLTIAPGALGGGIHLTHTQSGRTVGSADARVHTVTLSSAWTSLPPGVPVRNTTLDATPGRPSLDPPTPAPGRCIATVEHLLSALAGLGVWDAHVTIEGGPELPILDGSAEPFVRALLPALRAAPAPEPIVLTRTIEVSGGGATITAGPPPHDRPLSYTYSLDYGPGSPIPAQRAAWTGSITDYAQGIAPARTFSLEAEARAARAAGLFAHVSPRDMLVIGDDGAPIENTWREEHEPARHKLLDLIGDLALLGRPLHATVVAHRSGHALTHELCRRIVAEARPG